MTLVLASGSPRRHVLLQYLNPEFAVQSPDVDETLPAGETLAALEAVAARKAAAVNGEVVLAADTAVLHGDQILGKPEDLESARTMLQAARTPHQVVTALAVKSSGHTRTATVVSTVQLNASDEVLDDYLASGQWRGKAGAYGVQDAALADCVQVSGSWSNVVGLPLAETADMLRDAGISVAQPPSEADLRAHNPF